jgi:hypothetical protein
MPIALAARDHHAPKPAVHGTFPSQVNTAQLKARRTASVLGGVCHVRQTEVGRRPRTASTVDGRRPGARGAR